MPLSGGACGTPRRPVDETLAAGGDVLFDVDWQGRQQLREVAEARECPGETARASARLGGATRPSGQ
jgi:hypothetical protein